MERGASASLFLLIVNLFCAIIAVTFVNTLKLLRMFSVSDIKRVMRAKGYQFFDSGLYNLNLIGVRTVGKVDLFDDELYAIYKNDIGEESCLTIPITTDPGAKYLNDPINEHGTAILVPGQYAKMWKIGLHRGKYEALVQNRPVRVYRDNDRDSEFDLDPKTIEEGNFGINLHHAAEFSISDYVGPHSAGCQVVKVIEDYRKLKNLWRRAASQWGDEFTYTLLVKEDF